MTLTVNFQLRASCQRQLLELYEWIANDGAPTAAERFVSSIIEYCERLVDMPMIGAARDDIRPGLRTVGFRHRAVIAFQLAGTRITILGVFYGRQDYEARLARSATCRRYRSHISGSAALVPRGSAPPRCVAAGPGRPTGRPPKSLHTTCISPMPPRRAVIDRALPSVPRMRIRYLRERWLPGP